MDEKRTIDGYAVLHAIRIDGAEQIVAEKDSRYGCIAGNGYPPSALRSTLPYLKRDYLKAMRESPAESMCIRWAWPYRVYRGSPHVDYPLSARTAFRAAWTPTSGQSGGG
jgi:hypothetical protein